MPHLTLRDGQKLHYLDIGRGPVCVLLHGFGMRAAHWLPFVAPLALNHRFILPDLRGFGGSHRLSLSQDCLLTDYADDLEELAQALDLREFHLGGISMGALTALHYQRRHGFERVRAYLHMDQSPMVRNTGDWRWGLFGHAHEARTSEIRELITEMQSYERDRPWHTVDREVRDRLWLALSRFMGDAFHSLPLSLGSLWLLRREVIGRRLLPPDNWAAYLDVMRSYLDRDYDMRQSLSRIEVPMTLFVGMDSVMYPAEGQLYITSQVKHAHVVRFRRCGHAIPIEAPLRFSRELIRFLDTPVVPRTGWWSSKVVRFRRHKHSEPRRAAGS